MKNKYGSDLAKYSTCGIIGKLIGKNKKVLDVGCNDGYLKKITDKSVDFYGIDCLENSVKIAEKENFYKKTVCLNLNQLNQSPFEIKFDVIIFADILEHLFYPEKVLKFFAEKNLEKNGEIIISLPNIANFRIRASLFLGNFNYIQSGILDKTHLHFYTLKTAKKFIKSCELEIIEKRFSSNYFGGIIKRFPFLGSLLGYTLIFVCKKK